MFFGPLVVGADSLCCCCCWRADEKRRQEELVCVELVEASGDVWSRTVSWQVCIVGVTWDEACCFWNLAQRWW